MIDVKGRRLLDPTKDAWGSHFELDGELIRPKPNDADAEYTREAYKMNARKKRDARELRAKKIRATLKRIQGDYEREGKLIHLGREERDTAKKIELFQMALEIRRARKEIEKDFISTYRAVPIDAPSTCRCVNPPEYKLPAWFAEQCAQPPAP